jgi:hypothetical protein
MKCVAMEWPCEHVSLAVRHHALMEEKFSVWPLPGLCNEAK